MPRNRRAPSRGPNDNLAARTGRWSTRHRKAAIFGWLAFVVGLLAWPSHIWPVDDAANSVILLIGLTVGVDYSLFYLRREREERARGPGPDAALEAAAATSGRAVIVSGLTVVIAVAGLFLTGRKELISVGVGTMLVVATAMAGSLTVLPALLSALGDRIDRGRLPFLGFRRQARESRVFGALVGGSGTDSRSEHALATLREELVPQTVGRVSGVETAVGGLTAESRDFNELLKARAPLVFAFVLGLAFLLLTAAFRSVVVAAKAVVLNLLCVGAAYGLLVATIVRGILLPAAMKLLGRWNWYLPRWLQWLPRLDRPQAAVARAGC
jgi:uncharacterized membrane protein YdfJ with MMPL/SSD domain